MNSVIEKEVVSRSVDSGMIVSVWRGIEIVQHPQGLVQFRDLEIGTSFKMFAGKWILEKVSATGARRVDRPTLDPLNYTTFDFEGWERCYVIPPQGIDESDS